MLLCAKYVFPITSDPISGGAVLVHGNRIEDVGKFADLKIRYPDEEIVDFGLAAIMPGFIDLFTKLDMSVMRGVVADEPFSKWMLSIIEKSQKLEIGDWHDSAVLGGLDAISFGITTVADISRNDATLQAVKKLGLRSVVYYEVGAMDKMRIDYAMHTAEREINKWEESINGDLITIGIAPAPLYANHPEVFRRINDLAIKMDLPVAMRLAGSREEYNFVKYGSSMFAIDNMDITARGYVEIPPWLPFGVTPVRYALNWGAFDAPNVMLIEAVHVTDEDIKKIKEHDVSICTCPRANAQLGVGIAPLYEFLQAGIRVGLGTDSPAATESADMLSEMRMGLLLHRANNPRYFFDSSTMLELATIGGARALKIDDKVGSLEVGKLADIIALDLSSSHQSPEMNPVSAAVNTCTTGDVLMTMVDGKILYEKDHWGVSVEVAKNIARVIEIRTKLRS